MPFDNPPQPRREIVLLRAAKDQIRDPGRWMRNGWGDKTGLCAIQAVRNVCATRTSARRLHARRSAEATRLARLLAQGLPARYRRCFFLTATTRVILYNDRKSTSHAMMMELFDAAIARLEFESV
jgi:hypothetical protein